MNVSDTAECWHCGRAFMAVQRIESGTLLAHRYLIERVLGSGGMGMVLRAHDRELDETVALKVLRADLARSEDMAQRFRREIKLARRVRHHNVCGIHEYGSDGGVAYISMELVDGADLKHLIRQHGAFPTGRAFDVCIQIASGLQAIHDAGIIHRDLKTSNIMLDRGGRVVLMDFGIAKDALQGRTQAATAVGQIIGTPEYMSPEQARGQAIDSRSDLYALGIIVFEIFSGRVPFQGLTPMATLFKNLEDPPPLEGAAASGIPNALVPVLAKALAKDPEQRYASAREMASAIAQARTETLGPGNTPARAEATLTIVTSRASSEPQPTIPTAPNAVPPLSAPHQSTLARAAPDHAPVTTPLPASEATVNPSASRPAHARPVVVPVAAPPGPPDQTARRGPSPSLVVGSALLAAIILMTGWHILDRQLGPQAGFTESARAPLRGSRSSDHEGAPDEALESEAKPQIGPREPSAKPAYAPKPSLPRALDLTLHETMTTERQSPAPHDAPPTPWVPASPMPLRAPVEPTPLASTEAGSASRTGTLKSAADVTATLQFRVQPWARVSVDGEVVGTTPFAPLSLQPGSHQIEFVHPDFRPVRRRITLRPGEILKLELDLTLDAVPN